jgi:hypothetical protein
MKCVVARRQPVLIVLGADATNVVDSLIDPVPVQVRDGRGTWHDGFLLLEFLADGTAAIRSERTDQVRNLPQGEWRDPVEEKILRRLAFGGLQLDT